LQVLELRGVDIGRVAACTSARIAAATLSDKKPSAAAVLVPHGCAVQHLGANDGWTPSRRTEILVTPELVGTFDSDLQLTLDGRLTGDAFEVASHVERFDTGKPILAADRSSSISQQRRTFRSVLSRDVVAEATADQPDHEESLHLL
jgi:hypothetical protein